MPLETPPLSVDLIFRSSEKLARGSVDQFEIWNGELLLKDVPVISPLRDKPATD
jgi:hypothetical protein